MRVVSGRCGSILLLLLILIQIALPFPPVASADGGAPNLAYVSGSPPGISVIDVGQARVTKTIPVPGNPHTILLSLDGRYLYVTQPDRERVSVIATFTEQTICTAHIAGTPTLLALDQNENILYAAGNGATTVSALDPLTCALKHTFEVGSPVYGIALTSPGVGVSHITSNQLWVAGAQTLTIFDDYTGRSLSSVAIPGGPHYLSIPPGGDTVYVTTHQGTVDAVDIRTHTIHQLLSGGIFGPMDYDALSYEIYVPDAQHHLLDVLAPVDPSMTTLPREPEREIRLDAPPASVAITNDGQLGFVAFEGGKVAMLDLLDRQVAYTVSVGGTPQFIITGLYPTAIQPGRPGPSKGNPPLASRPPILLFPGLPVIVLVLVVILILQYRRAKHRGQVTTREQSRHIAMPGEQRSIDPR